MSSDNDQAQTQNQEKVPIRITDGSTPDGGSAAVEPVAAAVPVMPPSREELYPRADGPIEADRDVPQPIDVRVEAIDDVDDDNDEEEGDEPSSAEAVEPASHGEPTSPAAATPPNQPAAPSEGGRRRRRRRRGRGRDGQTPQPQAGGAAAPGSTGTPSASGAPVEPNHPAPGRQDNRSDRHDRGHDRGGRGRDQNRGDRRERSDHREERHERHDRNHERNDRHSGERTNEVRGVRPPVKREVLANTSFEETRIAILENGRLAELHWERKSSQNIVGNIYKGTVENVLPGISSAFINIGFEKNAYLYISDVLGDKGAAIDATLKKGQQIMVQVAKEAISTKGPKVTMDVTLPGRYLVFTPFQNYVGISKHISEAEERQRLERIVDRLVATHLGGKGLVVRTEAEGATEEELEREVKYLLNAWQQIQKKFDETPPPTLLHQDLSLALQIARDIMSEQVYVYMVDDKAVHKEVVDFVVGFAPDLKDRVRFYESKTPILKAFNVEREIVGIRDTKVSLPNGGSIVIQEAESLCAIDVNTGRFTGSKSQEETVTQTNIEAAHMVAQQLRLRNIGGIIVVDFIDMRKASNRQKVMEAFANACKADRAKIRILPITRLGLIELTRERKRMSTAALLTSECPQCRGSGRVLSAETLRIKIQREIFEMTGGRPGGSVRVLLHPDVAETFRSQHSIIEKNIHRSVKIQTDPQLMWEDYRIILE